jgi:hypothetical protein
MAILWFAIGMRAEYIGARARAGLSALGLLLLWGTIVAVVLTAVIDTRRQSAH